MSALLSLTNEGVSCFNRRLLATVCGTKFHTNASFSPVLTHVSASPCTLLLFRLLRDEGDANPLISITVLQGFCVVIKHRQGHYSDGYSRTVNPPPSPLGNDHISDLTERKYKQEVLGSTNRLLSLIRHGPYRKLCVQHFF
jgi:hypothetical protein